MPRLRRRGHGDLYVQVQVVTPDSLNAEQTEALEQFAEAGGEEVEARRPLPEAEELAVSDFRHRHALVCGEPSIRQRTTRARHGVDLELFTSRP